MKNSKLIGTISAIVVLCLILGSFIFKIVIPYIANGSMIPCMFSDISECENLGNHDGIKVEKYNTPKKDKELKDLKYEKFYAAKISCSEFEFEIFAYEFKDSESAKKYFENNTGIDTDKDTTYLISFGLSSGSQIVISEEKAYVFYSSSNDRYRVSDFLKENFTIIME